MPRATNKYPGKCCYCGQPVSPHKGVLLRLSGKFVPAHPECDPETYETPDRFDMQVEDNMRDACGL